MAKPNLSAMSIEALIDLRRQIDETLAQRRAEIETELKRMDGIEKNGWSSWRRKGAAAH